MSKPSTRQPGRIRVAAQAASRAMKKHALPTAFIGLSAIGAAKWVHPKFERASRAQIERTVEGMETRKSNPSIGDFAELYGRHFLSKNKGRIYEEQNNPIAREIERIAEHYGLYPSSIGNNKDASALREYFAKKYPESGGYANYFQIAETPPQILSKLLSSSTRETIEEMARDYSRLFETKKLGVKEDARKQANGQTLVVGLLAALVAYGIMNRARRVLTKIRSRQSQE